MNYYLPTARTQERIRSIPCLPKETVVIFSNREEEIDIDYPNYITKEYGFWNALNEAIESLDWYTPFMWLADDIKPQAGWIETLNNFYERSCSSGLGLVVANDMILKDYGAIFAVITKAWLYVLFGIPRFPSEFGHSFLDTLIADRSKDLGRYYFCYDAVVEHMHPSKGKAKVDDVYIGNAKYATKKNDKNTKDFHDIAWMSGEKINAEQRLKEMVDKKAYFIIGLEGSGTYMLRDAITNSGEVFYHPDENSSFDKNVVVRRSIPHAHIYPDITKDVERLEKDGFDILIIFMIRSADPCLKSVMRRDPTKKLNMRDYWDRLAYLVRHIMIFFDRCEVITYEAFILDETFRRAFFERIGVSYPEDMEFYNGNEKYYV